MPLPIREGTLMSDNGAPARLEFWTTTRVESPAIMSSYASRAEGQGWDGIIAADTQNLVPDPYVRLSAAACGTVTLKLAVAVTNVTTRHPAVTAAAIASLNTLSDGRAVLGLGRGDSALAHVGAHQPTTARFERYTRALHAYLAGEDVALDQIADWGNIGGLSPTMGNTPAVSRLNWLSPEYTGVPIHVAASGPRTIEMATRAADAVTFSLGADRARLEWAVSVARAAYGKAGPPPALGAYVPIAPFEDPARVRAMTSGVAATFARMSAMYGHVSAPVADAAETSAYQDIAVNYDMTKHASRGTQTDAMPQEFLERFAVVGSPARCVDRLSELIDVGIRRFYLVVGSIDSTVEDLAEAHEILAQAVLPKLRATAG